MSTRYVSTWPDRFLPRFIKFFEVRIQPRGVLRWNISGKVYIFNKKVDKNCNSWDKTPDHNSKQHGVCNILELQIPQFWYMICVDFIVHVVIFAHCIS